MSYVWKIRGFDRDAAAGLCRGGVNPLPAAVLATRGISDLRGVKEFLADDATVLSDPMDMIDMDRAAARVKRAVADGEHVAVYGDYDVDGITSSCMVAEYLRSRGLVCDIYIPGRLEEGYGVKSAALDTIKGRGATLVVTVDCGITAVEEARHAREIGLDLVITDHHECVGGIPEAVAAVDPKRPDCPSVFKGLASVGVAFALLRAVEGPGHEEELFSRFADFVAIGTVADVMPVTGENRVFVKRGLVELGRGRRPGLRELRVAAGQGDRAPNVSSVGFALAPRINAAGRLGDTDVAVELLLTRDPRRAAELAAELCNMNRERQRIEGEMFEETLGMLERNPPEGKPIVLASHKWHQGVCGIVASRLADRFGLPAVMICLKDGVGRGSCRSVEGFNLFDALADCQDMLLGFGGHEMAAGLTVREERVDDLRRALGERFAAMGLKPATRTLDIDFEVVKPALLSARNVEALEELEPYGPGNPQPVLCMRGVTVENAAALSKGRHTKLWVSKAGQVFEAVYFSRSPEELGVEAGGRAAIAFSPQINEFRGRRSVQLCLEDFGPEK